MLNVNTKVDFRKMNGTRNRLLIMRRVSVHQEDVTVLNVGALSNSFKVHEAKAGGAEENWTTTQSRRFCHSSQELHKINLRPT